MGRLGVPFKRDLRGSTPGVLRGSGATYLYLETEDLSKVAWRGRRAKLKTVEFYLTPDPLNPILTVSSALNDP